MINLTTIALGFLFIVVIVLAGRLFYLRQDFNFLEKYVNDLGVHVSEQTVRFNKLLKFLLDSAKENKPDKKENK